MGGIFKGLFWVIRKCLKFILAVLLIAVLFVCGFVAYLTITQYDPEPEETVMPVGNGNSVLSSGDTIKFLTWNAGYGALGDNADFFMDGGSMVYTAEKDRVESNMNTLSSEIGKIDPNIIFVQEIDVEADRSYKIDETEYLRKSFPEMASTFSTNFKVNYVPYPIPPIGQVYSGLLTLSDYDISYATRYSLPSSFTWPISVANLKRGLLVSHIDIADSDKELVLIDLHLEAYDEGDGKIAQTNFLCNILKSEYDKGNYVIAGGDFNQVFSNVDTSAYPMLDEEGIWEAGTIDVTSFGNNFTCITDSSCPTCRSLDKVYEGADKDNFQYYVIDGYIVSDNITINSVETQNLGFVCSDHNPVVMSVTLN
ncbi:MAG: endonuclease [Butyrivibrio sp.]|nr:endonuclease [Butyrivibrio sp.]